MLACNTSNAAPAFSHIRGKTSKILNDEKSGNP